jgi:His/Glu/Gln/Arg/opine family amino acid ABC transporter permease subunit
VDALVTEFPSFVLGFFGTLRISLFAGVGALVLGTLLATFRVSPLPPLRAVGTAWVTVFRNSPLAVMLFVFAFALPQVGVQFPTLGGNAFFWPGVTALALGLSFSAPSYARQDEATRLDQKVEVLYQAGKYAAALPLAQESLAVREKGA